MTKIKKLLESKDINDIKLGLILLFKDPKIRDKFYDIYYPGHVVISLLDLGIYDIQYNIHFVFMDERFFLNSVDGQISKSYWGPNKTDFKIDI